MLMLFSKKNKVADLREALSEKSEIEKQASEFLQQLKSRNFNVALGDKVATTTLGATLESIRLDLSTAAKSEEERSWTNLGLAKFGDILRNKGNLQLQQLADDILSNVVKYMNVNQGALFVLNDDEQDPHLSLLACYAYDRKKYQNRRINLGEGQVGQCVFEKDVIYLRQVPANYTSITSGLGQASPRTVIICPLIISDQVLGVLELASFEEIPEYRIQFLRKLCENIAATIRNVRETDKVLALLNVSQQQTEALRAQEEELRQNMEELQATQEEMERKTIEIRRSSAEMSGIVNGINATMATIEFTPDGTITMANENFLNVVGYRLTEILGQHHKIFLPEEVLTSKEYATFWQRLATGKPLTGIFKRKASDGRIVWLNAIYNPIVDQHNKVIKVMKFATDITTSQEMTAESTGIIEGINATMAVISFSPDGIVLDANSNFLNTMGYGLDSIKGKHHQMFVPLKIRSTVEYRLFWQRLKKGESLKGVFERMSATGAAVFLSAVYHPIRNAEGEVIKIMKFATVITDTAKDHPGKEIVLETAG